MRAHAPAFSGGIGCMKHGVVRGRSRTETRTQRVCTSILCGVAHGGPRKPAAHAGVVTNPCALWHRQSSTSTPARLLGERPSIIFQDGT